MQGGKTGLRGLVRNIRYAAKNRRIKTFIVSFPKTGRTWLRVMIGRALIEQFRLDESLLLDTYRATRAAGIGAARFSHGGRSHLLDDCPFSELTFDRELYATKRVAYLVRDVRDTLVSFYFQQAKRERVFDGDMHAFIRDERFGARKLIKFYTMWYQQRDVPQAFLAVSYEQMHAAPVRVLHDVMEFLGIDDVDPDAVAKAVEFSSFEKMKKMESQSKIGRKLMQPGDPNDAESFKVRKGKIGGFVDYLDAADLDYIREAIETIGDPACDWYLHE